MLGFEPESSGRRNSPEKQGLFKALHISQHKTNYNSLILKQVFTIRKKRLVVNRNPSRPLSITVTVNTTCFKFWVTDVSYCYKHDNTFWRHTFAEPSSPVDFVYDVINRVDSPTSLIKVNTSFPFLLNTACQIICRHPTAYYSTLYWLQNNPRYKLPGLLHRVSYWYIYHDGTHNSYILNRASVLTPRTRI